MATIPELKAQLREEQFQLYFAKQVSWGNANAGAVNFHNQLIKVERLQIELNKALAEEAGG